MRKSKRRSKRRSRKRISKRKLKRRFGSSDSEFISKFETKYPKAKNFSKNYTIPIIKFAITPEMFGSKEDYEYYEPLIDTAIINYTIHPETFDWVAHTYYNNQKLTSLSGQLLEWTGFETGLFLPYKQENVTLFENNLNMLSKFEFSVIHSIVNILIKSKIKKEYLSEAHTAIINFFLYPDTLKYVMIKLFPDNTYPSVFRHELYKRSGKIFISLLLMSAVITSFVYRKKITKEISPLVKYVVHYLSPLKPSPKSPKRRSRS